jgi:nucleoside 2-deoxyribosyltransferase
MRNRLSCFVIMPYSGGMDVVFGSAIVPALRSVKRADILPLRADAMGQQELTLRAHIQGAVDAADFCIVDVTGFNPNVMYEFGYAAARHKPMVTIVEDTALRLVPISIQRSSLIAYNKHDLPRFATLLAEAVEQIAVSTERTGKVRATGFSPSLFDEIEIIDEFTQSARFTLSAAVGSADVLVERLLPVTGGADKVPLDMRIVCADPEGEFARIRAADSGRPIYRYRDDLWHSLRSLVTHVRKRRDLQFELRMTQRVLGTSIYISDEIALIQPYLLAGTSREDAGIVLFKGAEPSGFSLFQHQFGRLWAESVPAPLEGMLLGRRET